MLIGFSHVSSGSSSTHTDRFDQIYQRTWEIVLTGLHAAAIIFILLPAQTLTDQVGFSGTNVKMGYILTQTANTVFNSTQQKTFKILKDLRRSHTSKQVGHHLSNLRHKLNVSCYQHKQKWQSESNTVSLYCRLLLSSPPKRLLLFSMQ